MKIKTKGRKATVVIHEPVVDCIYAVQSMDTVCIELFDAGNRGDNALCPYAHEYLPRSQCPMGGPVQR